jgi:hypothetical protein
MKTPEDRESKPEVSKSQITTREYVIPASMTILKDVEIKKKIGGDGKVF